MNHNLLKEIDSAHDKRAVLLDTIHRALSDPKALTAAGWRELCRDAGAQLQRDAGLIARIGLARRNGEINETELKAGED